MSETWTEPGWDVTEGPAEGTPPWRAIAFACRADGCEYDEITAAPVDVPLEKVLVLRSDHQKQHHPDRAFDIEVQWNISALCSVCPDGIGKVTLEDEGIACQECGTYWSIDGTGGYRNTDR